MYWQWEQPVTAWRAVINQWERERERERECRMLPTCSLICRNRNSILWQQSSNNTTILHTQTLWVHVLLFTGLLQQSVAWIKAYASVYPLDTLYATPPRAPILHSLKLRTRPCQTKKTALTASKIMLSLLKYCPPEVLAIPQRNIVRFECSPQWTPLPSPAAILHCSVPQAVKCTCWCTSLGKNIQLIGHVRRTRYISLCCSGLYNFIDRGTMEHAHVPLHFFMQK